MDTSVLFEPITVRGTTFANRVVMAPMTRGLAPEGIPGAQHAEYYRKRAAGGTGLLITEGTVVERPSSRNEPGIPFFHGPALDGWRAVVEAVHQAGGAIAPQLWHVGSVSSMTANWSPDRPFESPSGLLAPDRPVGEAMTEEDVADAVAAFSKAAVAARDLGFDAIELHGAHGYLIDQFFWAGTNQRQDRWGGDTLPERARFAAEIVASIRHELGDDTPLILRVSQWKQQEFSVQLAPTPAEMEAWLGPLVAAGVDVLHCSQRRFWEPEYPGIDGESGLNFAGWAGKLTGAKTISVGSVGLGSDFLTTFTADGAPTAGIDRLVERMERGEFDMIAVGRALIAQPDWTNRVRAGEAEALVPFARAMLGTLD